MKKNIALYVLVIFVSAFLVLTYFYLQAKKDRNIAAAQKIQEMRAQLAAKDPMDKESFTLNTPYVEVKIEYPKDFPNIKEKIESYYNGFKDETNIMNVKSKADAEALGIHNGAKYQYYSEYRIATSSDTLSFIVQNYTYTGGAHGGTGKVVFNLDKEGKYLPADYFLPTKQLPLIYEFVYKDLKKQIEERSKMPLTDDSMLTAGAKPSRLNYINVWPDGDEDIVVYFGQYQVAPYAYGDFEVRVPKSLIK